MQRPCPQGCNVYLARAACLHASVLRRHGIGVAPPVPSLSSGVRRASAAMISTRCVRAAVPMKRSACVYLCLGASVHRCIPRRAAWAGSALLQVGKERRKADRQRCGLAEYLSRNGAVASARRIFHLGPRASTNFHEARAESGPRKWFRAKPKAVQFLGPLFGPKSGTEKRDHFLNHYEFIYYGKSGTEKRFSFWDRFSVPKTGPLFGPTAPRFRRARAPKCWRGVLRSY